MSKAPGVGLVCGGRISRSFLGRLPRLAEHLGPVKALSYRVASRVANTIGAGSAVSGYEPFNGCRLILISVPEVQFPSTRKGLLDAPLDWAGKSVVLCETWRGSESLKGLEDRGASCGSLSPIFDTTRGWLLAEGSPLARQHIRELVGPPKARLIEIGAHAKALYLAAPSLLEGVLPSVLAAAAQTLRAAGLSHAQALDLVNTFADQAVRAHAKGGRKAWGGLLAADEREAILSQIQSLRRDHPALARFFLNAARGALEYSGRDPRWLDQS